MSDLAVLASHESFSQWRASIFEEPIMFIPTMGALHHGHLALIATARSYLKSHHNSSGKIVLSIYVNPTQFTEISDFENYPNTLDDDIRLCDHNAVDVLFLPRESDIYPEGLNQVVSLDPGTKAQGLESIGRPGHFAGVITVLDRLFNIVMPNAAFFGEKDFQQLAVVTDYFSSKSAQLKIISVPTVRDSSGIALSSRNERLSITGQGLAKQIPAAFALAEHLLSEGHSIAETRNAVADYLANQPGISFEYFEILTDELLQVIEPGRARMLLAVSVNSVRLIDNLPVEIRKENVISD